MDNANDQETNNNVFCNSGFTESEYKSVAILGLRLLCADRKISRSELVTRDKVFREFGITYEMQQKMPSYDDACHIYNSMSLDKHTKSKALLHDLAEADGIFTDDEKDFISDIEKK